MYQDLTILTDAQLIASLKSLVLDERKCLVAVLRHLREMDRRRLADKSGFPSLFEYCVRELRYAHGATARLIHASRAATKHPVLYRALERGLLSLTTVSMLAPYLTRQNYRELIRAAAGRSTREVEAVVASLNPVAAEPAERVRFLAVARVDKTTDATPVDDLFAPPEITRVETEPAFPPAEPALPQVETTPSSRSAEMNESPVARSAPPAPPAPSAPSASPAPPAPTDPPPPAVRRVQFSFTGDEALLRDVERAKDLSRHKWPGGKYEDVFTGAVKALLEKIDPDRRTRRKERARRLAAGARSRNIAQAVRDIVWRRDEGRCVYKIPSGRACGARAGLEFDHLRPWALGGPSTVDNLRLLCRTHNDLEARRAFGGAAVDAAIAAARRREPCGGG